MCAAEMALCGIIYFPSFMNIGKGIQAILRFRLRNFKRVSISFVDERKL
jgi:hypothetical protein